MSKNEKLKADMPAVPETVKVTVTDQEIDEIMLTTDLRSNPLKDACTETADEIVEEITREIELAEIRKAIDSEMESGKSETGDVSEAEEKEKAEETETTVHRINAKRLGMMLTAGAVCVFTAGVVGLMGLVNGGVETKAENESESFVALSEMEAEDSDPAVPATMSWWMAGINENDIIDDEETSGSVTTSVTTAPQEKTTPEETTTEKTTTTAEETTTTTAKTTTSATTTTPEKTTTAAPVTTTAKKTEYTTEKIDETVFYLTDNVNLRKGAGTNYDKITTLKKGTAITATHKCSNGWYKVTVGDKTGYLIDDYLTTKKPAQTTTTTAKPADTATNAPAQNAEDTAASSKPVISYTDEELQMFYYVVEGEAGGCSDKAKLAVANVIINRVQSSKFANTLTGVLTAKGQFTAIKNYYNKSRTPTSSTKDCVKRALAGEDNSNGAIYFYSKRYCSQSTANWFESLTFCLEVDGQRFFK